MTLLGAGRAAVWGRGRAARSSGCVMRAGFRRGRHHAPQDAVISRRSIFDASSPVALFHIIVVSPDNSERTGVPRIPVFSRWIGIGVLETGRVLSRRSSDTHVHRATALIRHPPSSGVHTRPALSLINRLCSPRSRRPVVRRMDDGVCKGSSTWGDTQGSVLRGVAPARSSPLTRRPGSMSAQRPGSTSSSVQYPPRAPSRTVSAQRSRATCKRPVRPCRPRPLLPTGGLSTYSSPCGRGGSRMSVPTVLWWASGAGDAEFLISTTGGIGAAQSTDRGRRP